MTFANAGITEPIVIDVDGRDTLEEALVLGDEALIGFGNSPNFVHPMRIHVKNHSQTSPALER